MDAVSLKTAQLLLKIKAVLLRPQKPFRYTSGILSPIYIDNRLIISYPSVRQKIVRFYVQVLKTQIGLTNIDLLSGTATAAIPHTAFVAQKLKLPMVYVRDTKKGHGRENQIEGVVKKGQKVVIIEDHISTGGSLLGNVRAIRSAGGRVKYAVATTTYLFKTADQAFKKAKIKVFTLTNFKDIVDVAVKEGYMKEKHRHLVLEWAYNPQAWGKRFGYE